jgi:hypothetical protein
VQSGQSLAKVFRHQDCDLLAGEGAGKKIEEEQAGHAGDIGEGEKEEGERSGEIAEIKTGVDDDEEEGQGPEHDMEIEPVFEGEEVEVEPLSAEEIGETDDDEGEADDATSKSGGGGPAAGVAAEAGLEQNTGRRLPHDEE